MSECKLTNSYGDTIIYGSPLRGLIAGMDEMLDDKKFMKTKIWDKIDWTKGKTYCQMETLEIYHKHYLTPARRKKLIKKYVDPWG